MWKRIGKDGNKYWGNKGAGIFFTNGKKVLLLKRAEKGDNKDTWTIPGGKIEEGESSIDAAKRESIEECGKLRGNRFHDIEQIDGQHVWTTFFFKVDKLFKCKLSDEHSDWNWFNISELKDLNLHPKFKENLDRHINVVNKYFKKSNFKEWLLNRQFKNND